MMYIKTGFLAIKSAAEESNVPRLTQVPAENDGLVVELGTCCLPPRSCRGSTETRGARKAGGRVLRDGVRRPIRQQGPQRSSPCLVGMRRRRSL
jgi:hypothetical protein